MGAKIALRAPTTTGAPPSAIRCQCQCRSASLRWLCKTATSPKRWRNRSTVCGVRLISGTKHNRLTPVGDDLGDGLDVDLGLAAAGHAVDEDRLVLLRPDGGEDDVEGLLLIRIHRQLGLAFARRRAGFSPTLDSSSPRDNKTFAAEGVDRGRGAAGRTGQVLRRHRLGAAASTRITANCFSGSFAAAIRSRASSAGWSRVVNRVPA